MLFGRSIITIVIISLAGGLASCSSAMRDAATEYGLGNEALSRLDLKQALLHYDEAIRLDPEHARAHLNRGQVRWQSSQFEQAVTDVSRAIEIDSTLTWAYFLRGSSLVSLGRPEPAVEDLRHVIELNDLDADFMVRTHTWRSIALFNLGRYDESIEDLTRCIELDPDQPVHRIDRAGAYLTVGATDKAVADYRAALDMDRISEEHVQMITSRLKDLGVSVDRGPSKGDSTIETSTD